MNVLVIGGTGLLGQHTAAELLARGHAVTLIGRRPAPALLPALDHPDVRLFALDVWSAPDDTLRHLAQGHDACVYALGPDDRTLHPAPAARYLQDHLVVQTERILTAARAAGVRRAVVLGSYFATWHRMRPELRFAESHPYVQARVDQARRAVAAGGGQHTHGMDVCVLEIPYVFGTVPGQVPMWKTLYDRLRTVPLPLYPVGGTSVVTAAQVGQAAAAASEKGEHDARYPLADEQLTWTALLGLMLHALDRRRPVVGVPRVLLEPGARYLGRRLARGGRESGIDPRHVLRHVMYQRLFVDPAESLRVLGYRRGGVPEAIAETVAASYPDAPPPVR